MAAHYVYTFWDKHDAPLYVGVTGNVRVRWAEHKRLAPWFDQVHHTDLRGYETREEARAGEVQRILELRPLHNINHNSAVNEHGAKAGQALWRQIRLQQRQAVA